jgi:hypothetical protein
MKHLIAAGLLALIALPAQAARLDISGSCYQFNLPDGNDGSCASIGMTEGERFQAFIDIEPAGFAPATQFRVADAVTDWRVDFGGETFSPANTTISPVIGDFGGTFFNAPDRWLVDIDFGHDHWQTYLFLTTLDGAPRGELNISSDDGRGAILRVEPVPLPAAGWLLIGGMGAIVSLRKYAARRRPA